MTNSTKNVLAMHDLSGFGRCALSVIIPTLSALGVQVTAVPTAVMSTHTGGFYDFTFNDMTDSMLPAAEHYKKLGLSFDAVYSGFLGSEKQCEVVSRIIEMNSNSLRFIDPVMGDDGVMYKTYTKKLCDGVCELVRYADIITPNITEACILSGEKYIDFSNKSFSEAQKYAELLLEKIGKRCCGAVVITGVECTENGIRSVGCAVKTESGARLIMSPKEHKCYPGTGDIFASVLLGGMLSGEEISKAAEFAVSFTHDVIFDTIKAGTETRYGVLLEKNLHMLTEHAVNYGRNQ